MIAPDLSVITPDRAACNADGALGAGAVNAGTGVADGLSLLPFAAAL